MIITDEDLLRRPCEDVLPKEVGDLISTLEGELNRINRIGRGGIGLAAPQINILKKIAIVRLPKINLNLVNAKLAHGYDPALFTDEGCLSFPNRTENTMRFQEVHITDNLVEPHSFIATGLLSVVCQHEIGHYNSTLFIDRMAPKPMPIVKTAKVGPNELCPCGSKVKFKRCHGR